MDELFASLSHAVESGPLAASLCGGGLGCSQHSPQPVPPGEYPAHRGFHQCQERIGTSRAFSIAALFSAGILLTIAGIGAITAAAGRMMGDVGHWGNYFVAAFSFCRLNLLGVVPMPWSGPGQVNVRQKGLLAALILGLVFGLALGPCTFAYMLRCWP